jgi:3-hydroxyacyl-CoA dehydrogenase
VEPRRIGVIGAGVMGSGIAQVTATAGYETVCCDVSPQALAAARETVRSGRFGVERGVERGKLTREQADAALARLRFSASLEEAAAADLVIECVPEKLDLKVRLLRRLDETAPAHAILASNTSGFPIAALAAATGRPERVIGWHWASPPVVMRFAEIVVTDATSQETVAAVCAVAAACGKNPQVVKDSPMHWGFVANRIYFAMLREAQRVVDEGVAPAEVVNQLMVDCYNWPVGPFAMIRGAGRGWQ